MKRLIAVACGLALAGAAGPALAQFASSGGAGSGAPNISGAGTGLSAPSTIQPGAAGANPNALGTRAPVATPVPPVYPGVGAGGAGLPPPEVIAPARSAGTAAAHPH